MAAVHVLGIRHHGPGSARAVARALDELHPDCVVIEGAPELDAVAALAASPAMRPPVAALVYVPDQPRRSTFYPFASFSPEWVALRWALRHDVAARFVDLPAANFLAPVDRDPTARSSRQRRVRRDPIGELAAAAGFDDAERWWEDAVEHRRHGADIFDDVLDAMRELRADDPGNEADADDLGPQREAAMRLALRAATDRHERVAFVCGAWHAPAVEQAAWRPKSRDAALLKGLPKVKVAATWVPWTSSRLAYASGYGAGVQAPAWYEHLFTTRADEVVDRWLVRTARLLRAEDLDASSASVIETARLADALAVLRGRPIAGLSELLDATTSVLCEGSQARLSLVTPTLLVGNEMGAVPPETPMVPLARDLAAQQKRLRMRVSASSEQLVLDLRNDTHRARSHLLHRLTILGIDWGTEIDPGGTRGTFKEAWQIEWRPELDVAVIDASGLGVTVDDAATEKVRLACGNEATRLADLTRFVELCLLADLPAALSLVMDAVAVRAARQHDTTELMAAVEPLARVRRYGNVRQSDTEVVLSVLDGMVRRITVGLSSAAAALDDDAARLLRALVEQVHRALGLLDDDTLRAPWLAALRSLADQHGVHGLVAGRVVRLLLDASVFSTAEANRRLSRALSRGTLAASAAAWVDGFLGNDAILLLHDDALLATIDDYVSSAPADVFDDLLPLLRRTLSTFSAPERRAIGERVRRLSSGGTAPGALDGDDEIARDRAELVVPKVLQLLGLTERESP